MTMNFTVVESPAESAIATARKSGDETLLVEVLGNVKRQRSSRNVRTREVSDLLRETASTKVRNAAALALTDMKARDASGSIVEVLLRPGIATEAGTLLYALDQLGARIPLGILVDIIANGSFEARAEALTFMEEGRIEPADEAGQRAAGKRLSELEAVGSREVGEAAALALAYLGKALHADR